MSTVIISVNGKLDVLDVDRAHGCIPFASPGIVSMTLYVLTTFAARRRTSDSTQSRVEPLRQRKRQRSRRRPYFHITYPTFHPPVAHSLHTLTHSATHLAFGLLEIDDRVERLDVAARKRRQLYRKRVAGAQRAVHAQGLRWRRAE